MLISGNKTGDNMKILKCDCNSRQMLVSRNKEGFIVTTFEIIGDSQVTNTKLFSTESDCLEFACEFFKKKDCRETASIEGE